MLWEEEEGWVCSAFLFEVAKKFITARSCIRVYDAQIISNVLFDFQH